MKHFENGHIFIFYIFCYCEMRTWVVQNSFKIDWFFFFYYFKDELKEAVLKQIQFLFMYFPFIYYSVFIFMLFIYLFIWFFISFLYYYYFLFTLFFDFVNYYYFLCFVKNMDKNLK